MVCRGRSSVINVTLSTLGSVAVLTLAPADPQGLFDAALGAALARSWTAVRDDESVMAIVVASARRDFCLGAVRGAVEDRWFPAGHELWKPVILAVGGRCLGPGVTLLGQADMTIVADDVEILIEDDGPLPYREMAWLGGVLPYGELARLSLLGELGKIDARRAYELGIAADVVPPDRLLSRAIEEANALADLPSEAVQATKEVIQRGRNLYVRDAARLGQAVAASVRSSHRGD